MKRVARTFGFLFVIMLTLALFSGTALASGYDHCAEALQAMGLFKGTANGFELDRQATRAEAAVMLVRLLGVEEKALSGNYSHPFKDVPEWSSPHIGYMYESGLTKGTGATTFTPQGICDLQMYSTFILRALGYEEGAGDFTYAGATDFAYELGVVDMFSGSGAFLRDNVAAVSYTALFTPPKGVKTTLLAQLVEQGAVDAEAAKPYLTLFADYVQLKQAYSIPAYGLDAPLEVEFAMALNMDMGAEGKLDMQYDASLQLDASAVGEIDSLEDILAALNKVKFGMTNQIAVLGGPVDDELDMDIKFNVYLLDGVIYLDTDLGQAIGLPIPAKSKLDMAKLLDEIAIDADEIDMFALEDIISLYSEMSLEMSNNIVSLMPANAAADYYGIALIKSIKFADTAEGGKRFDVTMADISNDLILGVLEVLYDGIPEIMDALGAVKMSAEDIKYSYFLDKNGALIGLEVEMAISETIGTVTAKAMIAGGYHMTKAGAEVKITLPGKEAEYVDILELLKAIDLSGLDDLL